ncbi:MAG: flagellar biosynthesis repressor FlbT [Nitrospiraceae bacterium]|nr:flagellar biosynthesis repressor FlbT [Nitrospiraceae bacterium]
MALKIALKPGEKLIIGGAVISNGKTKSDFVVENTVPILREKDIMSLKDADSACKKIYFTIQLMYVDEKNIPEHHKVFWDLVKEVVEAAPSTRQLLYEIGDNILNNNHYKALKLTRKLIDYEQEAINHVRHGKST